MREQNISIPQVVTSKPAHSNVKPRTYNLDILPTDTYFQYLEEDKLSAPPKPVRYPNSVTYRIDNLVIITFALLIKLFAVVMLGFGLFWVGYSKPLPPPVPQTNNPPSISEQEDVLPNQPTEADPAPIPDPVEPFDEPSEDSSISFSLPIPAAFRINCVPPENWVPYTIKSGETLTYISDGFELSLSELETANCMEPHSILRYGEIIFAPLPTLPIPDVGPYERWIDVDLTLQRAYAYEGRNLVRSFIVSTGTKYYPTVIGQFNIQTKHIRTDLIGEDYAYFDVPYVMYFWEGYALHGVDWHNMFGTPYSHGCVNIKIDEAKWLFDWATIGTFVNVHK